MDCRKTDVFAKEWNRMCKSIRYGCEECPIWKLKSRPSMDCFMVFLENPTIAIKAVQRWSDENQPEIDWNKVPVDTPVLVRDSYQQDWRKRYFALCIGCGSERKLYALGDEKKQNEANRLTLWKYFKLAPEVDPTPYLKAWKE